jgi:hypothetical protein
MREKCAIPRENARKISLQQLHPQCAANSAIRAFDCDQIATPEPATSGAPLGVGYLIEGAALVRFAGAERRDVVDTFTEVETGKGADALERRPQLAAALKVVHRLTCPIVVSKLDVFDDATVRTIGRTFDAACKELKDTGQPDVVHEVMVKRIIAAAEEANVI